ncbi:MAG TPA: DUF1003 domain-containing protein [Terriglobia bacterium]|nr:DUF1003 domain-containing protein [Terriglobia bacterium]
MPIDPDNLLDIKLFELLDADDRRDLASVVDLTILREGELLFEKGDPSESLFIVCSGQVELFIRNIAGERIVLTVAGHGDLFGELSMTEGEGRAATAMALDDSRLISMTRGNLLLFFQKKPDAALDIIAALGGIVRKADDLLRTRVSRNVNVAVDETITSIQRVADWIAWFSGSMAFLAVNAVWFGAWILVNSFNLGVPRFDPYPFGLLTMIVSLEAIFLSIFVLISQNRQAEKDRVRANIDYEVNVKAELEVGELHEKTDRLQKKMLENFARLEKIISNGVRE